MPTDPPPRPWHAAVVWAISGERATSPADQPRPDVDAIVAWFATDDRLARARDRIAERRRAGEPWPFPTRADLDVPAAQLGAAVWAVRVRLGLVGAVTGPTSTRPPTADEQRLLREVPPHHG